MSSLLETRPHAALKCLKPIPGITDMTLALAPERIETWQLSCLPPGAQNAKAQGRDQIAKLAAASITEFGWGMPWLLAGDGEPVAGQGRVPAAALLAQTEAPVIVWGI